MNITHTQELNNFKRILPLKTFTQLRNSFQQIVEMLGDTANLITEDIFKSIEVDDERKQQKFSLIISEDFSALLLANNQISFIFIEIELILFPEKINNFIEELNGLFSNNKPANLYFKKLRETLAKNDNKIKMEYTLMLLEIITNINTEENQDINYNIENALFQQIQQEKLLHQVTINISNSLELPIILETAVREVREFLNVDRLVIYQFTSSGLIAQETGKVTYEAKASENVPSVMNFVEMETCFINQNECWEKYRRGFILTVEDTEKTFIFTPCLLGSMRKFKIRAKIVVPIIVQSKLWGLLIAHQCFNTRNWIEREQIFLQNIAEHLAIAIYQAQLYAELEQEKILLEKRVTERTGALYDSLMATEAANQAKSEFLATISHELRTPLTCVIGLSSTMLHWVFNPPASKGKSHNLTLSLEKQREYLQTIHDSGEHLLELINNILELSQMEAGKAMLDISEFSLVKLAKETLKTVDYKAKGKDVQLKIDLRLKSEIYQPEKRRQINGIWYDELELFIADETRIKQIILNLLNNGIKFTSKGGEVILRIWREGKDAVFQVEDAGIGIPPAQLDLIFAKFQQLESAYQRTYEGLGLGLALTKQLVELHNGHIEVESVVGQGSNFTVWIPYQGIQKEADKQPELTTRNKPLGTIVLIEDNDEIANLICTVLTTAEYQVVWLIESASAIGKIRLLKPKAVILNMQLMDIDVAQFIQSIRQSKLTQQSKILVLTELQKPEDVQLGMNAGADDYLLTSFHPEVLLQKIAELVNS